MKSLLPLLNSLDNSVLAMPADQFLALRTRILSGVYSTDSLPIQEGPIKTADGIALIPVNGALVKGWGEDICQFLGVTDLDVLSTQLAEARDNPDVGTILLHFNSPGGTCHAHSTATLIAEITQDKRVIGYSDSTCCSAAYELGAMCSELYISPTAWVGSIGTIFTRVNLTQANKEEGVSYTFITSSPKKLYLNCDTEISKEELEWIEQAVMYHYNIFKADVLSNREISEEYLDATILIGNQAVEPNLVDGIINSLDDLLLNLAESHISQYL